MHSISVENTAFATRQGLPEFRVAPFGFTHAPGVLQRLMEKVLASLNPEDGPDDGPDDVTIKYNCNSEENRKIVIKCQW